MTRRHLRPDCLTFLELLIAVSEGDAPGVNEMPFINRTYAFQRRPLCVAQDAYAGRLSKSELASLAKWAAQRAEARKELLRRAEKAGAA